MLRIEKNKRTWLQLTMLTAFVIFLFAPALHTGYFADDFDFLVRVRAGYSVRNALLMNTDGTQSGASWRPFTMLSFIASMHGNSSPVRDHAVSLILYAAICILIFFLLRTILSDEQGWISLGAAAVFAAIPIHAEPVVWVAARADLLAALFGIGALLAWAWGRRAAAVVLYICSLFSKEVWILLPFVFAVWPESVAVSHNSRTKYSRFVPVVMAIMFAAVWFLIRRRITGFGAAGYSTSAAGGVFVLLQHYTIEFLTFLMSGALFGFFQARVARFVILYWFIFFPLVSYAILHSVWFTRRTALHLWVLLGALLMPALLLEVPFYRAAPTVQEQRYWFAPSVALVLLLALLLWRLVASERVQSLSRHARIALLCVVGAALIVIGSRGVRYNIQIFNSAAVYRDRLLLLWNEGPGLVHMQRAALLPDSINGVHLFASPFFERALVWQGRQAPRIVEPWYQLCDATCQESAEISLTSSTIQIMTPSNRLQKINLNGLRNKASLPRSRTESEAIWQGDSWFIVKPEGVENLHPARY